MKLHELTECLLKKETMNGDEFLFVLNAKEPVESC
jgi:hypothetical protein